MRVFVGVTLAGFLALGQGLELLRLSPPAKVRPGDFAVQVWQIANRSPSPIQAKLRPEIPAGWEILGLPEALSLGPGEEEFLFLTLYVPRTAKSGVQPVRILLRWDGEEVVAEATVEVETVAALILSPPASQAAPPGASLTFPLRVTNRGNALDRVTLEVRTAAGWRVEVSPTELPLAPGETGEARVTLTLPAEAQVGLEVVLATARSSLAPEVEARTAWYVEVLPPGPERVPVQLYAELAMQGLARLAYDFLSGTGTSFLGFTGRGTVLDGALELAARWSGPWAAQPFQLLDFQATYVTDALEMHAGRVGFAFDSLLSPLGFWGLGAELSLGDVNLALGSGWEGERGRAGGRLTLRATWGETGSAYREERGSDRHSQAGTIWLALQALENVRFQAEGGAAQVNGLTRFAGEMRLTWEIPELFLLEARGYAVDPGFPALSPDRVGFLLSGRLGAEEAGFRFTCEWQRDNLRDLSRTTRVWQGAQASWDFFPIGWPLHFGFGLSLRRAADLSLSPMLDERTAHAEVIASFSYQDFTLGAQGTYTYFQNLVSGFAWTRVESREWLDLRFSPNVLVSVEFRQARFSSPKEERTQDEAALVLSVDEKLRLSWEYGCAGGLARAEFTWEPAAALTIKLGAEANWQEAGRPLRFGASLEFTHSFSWAPPFLPAFGVLSGIVFADLNGNSRRDRGEPGVPGAVLALDDVQVSSGKDGEFRFPARAPGVYTLQVVHTPAGYAAPLHELLVSLELGEKMEIALPLLPLARLDGLIFLDVNADGVWTPGEQGLSRAYVRIVPSEGKVLEVPSDSQGRFSWPELLPGKYRVELVLESLPPRHEPTTPVVAELVLLPGEKKNVTFGVRERPRPVVVIQPPLADFTWTPSIPKAGEPVLFDGTLSQAFNGEIVSYAWDFNNDGHVEAEGVRVTWVFPEAGFYLVALIVTDSAGFTGQTQYLLQVRP
ncbi:MAG: PKD domain-containing protein [Candidatus Bipolaricaulota bacterium]|nr:PKD domain-containing protein [Candidatus Bipolaricaulota bacterium]MDW8126184.1 PKD domain-containing protein [Candidatus Bipolaricaulota bacterium]